MYKKYVIFIALLGAVTSGCGKEKMINDTLPVIEIKTENFVQKTEKIGVYIDTTPSMKGFIDENSVGGEAENYYVACLDKISNIISDDYEKDDITYYRVDTPLWSVNENVLLKAKDSNYYNESDIWQGQEELGYKKIGSGEAYDTSSLTFALKEAEKDLFSIIVTDLYENFYENGKGTIDLIQTLKDSAAQKNGKIFGLIGIRSAFSGKVHDIGPKGETDEYGIEEKRYRPFYIIVWGSQEKVVEFCEQVKRDVDIPEENYKYKLFYQEELSPVNFKNFQNCEVFSKDIFWNSGKKKILINKEQELTIYTYEMKNDSKEELRWFSYSIPSNLQEQFKWLVNKIGTSEQKNIGDNVKELKRLNCQIVEETYVYNAEVDSFEKEEGIFFIIEGIYCDMNNNKLYVSIEPNKEQLSDNIRRFQWKAAYEASGEETMWWKEWGSQSDSRDFEKTEELEDYVEAINNTVSHANQIFLDGVVYIEVED